MIEPKIGQPCQFFNVESSSKRVTQPVAGIVVRIPQRLDPAAKITVDVVTFTSQGELINKKGCIWGRCPDWDYAIPLEETPTDDKKQAGG
jgi:hypothetical protein